MPQTSIPVKNIKTSLWKSNDRKIITIVIFKIIDMKEGEVIGEATLLPKTNKKENKLNSKGAWLLINIINKCRTWYDILQH